MLCVVFVVIVTREIHSNRRHLQAIPEPIVTAEANCGVTGGSGERPSVAGGDVAQGSSLPESVTTRASTDCYVTRSGRLSIPVCNYQAGVGNKIVFLLGI